MIEKARTAQPTSYERPQLGCGFFVARDRQIAWARRRGISIDRQCCVSNLSCFPQMFSESCKFLGSIFELHI